MPKLGHVPTYPLGFKPTYKVLLAPNQIKKLYLHLREDDNKLDYLLLVQHFVGDLINIPLKWVHQVRNLQACVKFAWDFYKLENMKTIVQSNHMGCSIIANAQDYMAITWILSVIVIKFF
jgi:hypothetical protein